MLASFHTGQGVQVNVYLLRVENEKEIEREGGNILFFFLVKGKYIVFSHGFHIIFFMDFLMQNPRTFYFIYDL